MTDVSIAAPSSYVAMPWRNGLGTTLELLKQALPGEDGFAWRLSMADVICDGAFSSFGGYDRTLLLLEGNGLTLDCDGQLQRLETPLQAARFRGEASTFASLHDGPVRDFNVMTRREYCSALVTAQPGTGPWRTAVDAGLLLIYAVDGELIIERSDFGQRRVPAQHLLIVQDPSRQVIHGHGAAHITTQIRRIENG